MRVRMENCVSFGKIICASMRLVGSVNLFLEVVKLGLICLFIIIDLFLAAWKRRSRPLVFFMFAIYIIIFSGRIFNVSNILVGIAFVLLFLLWLLFWWFFLFHGYRRFLISLFIFNLDLSFVCFNSLVGDFFGNNRNRYISFDCLICTLLLNYRRIFIGFWKFFNYLWCRNLFLLFVSGLRFSFILNLFLFWLLLWRWCFFLLLLRFRLFGISIFDCIVFLFLLKESKSDDIKEIPQHVSDKFCLNQICFTRLSLNIILLIFRVTMLHSFI